MPSDLAKKKAAKKKEAAKARQRPKKAEEVNGEGEKPEGQENYVSELNGEFSTGSFFESQSPLKLTDSPISALTTELGS